MAAASTSTTAAPPPVPVLEIPTGKLGMWLFLISEIMFFTGLIGSYLVLRMGSPSWPNPAEVLNTALLGVNTLVLLTSSLTMVLALQAAQTDQPLKVRRYLALTALLGTAFLVIKGLDYVHMWHEGFTMQSNLFGSCYYLLTGFHGLHVLSGIICVLYLWAGARCGVYGAQNFGRIENIGLYWHFIDIVWVLLFAILCLV